MTTTRNGINWVTAVLVAAVAGLFIEAECCWSGEPLAGTSALEDHANGAAEMVAGVDHFASRAGSRKPIGVIGYGEGGMIALLGLHTSATAHRDLRCSIASRRTIDNQSRQNRQLEQVIEFTQKLVRQAESRRKEFWSKADPTSPQAWHESCAWYRRYQCEEVIGRLPDPRMPMNPRTRMTRDMPAWRGCEVVLDVWPDVCAQEVLLVPGDLRPGERRPLVVCQHGLEGDPYKTIDAEFDGAHEIHGEGTVRFLHRCLDWPER